MKRTSLPNSASKDLVRMGSFGLLLSALMIGFSAQSKAQTFLEEYRIQISEIQKKILDLADVIPQSQFPWRPATGVRSVGEVYLHIAFQNYLITNFSGYGLPEQVANRIEVSRFAEWDASTTDKVEIGRHLQQSFEHLAKYLGQMRNADLETSIQFFDKNVTKRDLLFSTLSHLHEHLGQSIAYARLNGVVPPWTAAKENMRSQKSTLKNQ